MTINEYNELYQHPMNKQMQLVFSETGQSDITLTNTDICSEEMSLEESLCEEDSLEYGCCNASCFKIKVVNSNSFKGKTVVATQTVPTEEEFNYLVDQDGNRIVNEDGDYIVFDSNQGSASVPYGTYKVYSDKLTNDRMWRELVCYDAMYDIINADVTNWFSGLTFPMTIKNLRDSFFNYLGIQQVTTTLVNDNFSTKGGFIAEGQLAGKVVIESICQLNGVFGHINREGKFEYISVPSSESVTYAWYIDGTGSYEDYMTDKITGISARASSDDVGTSVGTSTNEWVIIANPLVYGQEGTQELITALTNLLNKVKNVTYRPFEVETYGNPGLPIGTSIKLNVRKYDTQNGYSTFAINSLVMKRELTGLQALKDSISASGDKQRKNDVNSARSEIIKTQGKVHQVINTVDEHTEIISEMDEDLGLVESSIEQLKDRVTLSVKHDTATGKSYMVEVALGVDPSSATSYFDVTADNIDLSANDIINIFAGNTLDMSGKNIIISFDNFVVDEDGNVTANYIEATGGSIAGFEIDQYGVALESDYIRIDPESGLYINPNASGTTFTSTYNMNGITLGDWVEITASESNQYGRINLFGKTSTHDYELNVKHDDIVKTTENHVSGKTTGWGGSKWNSLETCMDKLFNYQRIQADTEYTRTAQYCYGFVTANATELHLFVPMLLAFDIPNDTSVYITSCTASIRLAEGGYAGNLGNDGNYLPYYDSGVASQVQGGLRLKFKSASSMGGVWANTNNTPVTGLITLTFAIRNYNWYSAEGGTLVVREKISDGSFRWYFNDYDASQNGRIDYETSWRHFVPTRLRKFAKCPEGAPPWYDTQQREYNYDIVQGTNKYPGASSWFGFEWQKTDYPTTPIILGYHTEYLYQGMIRGIIESTDFALTPSYYAGGASSSIVRRSDHSWIEPTFDPING